MHIDMSMSIPRSGAGGTFTAFHSSTLLTRPSYLDQRLGWVQVNHRQLCLLVLTDSPEGSI
jgi:hypothetical protein